MKCSTNSLFKIKYMKQRSVFNKSNITNRQKKKKVYQGDSFKFNKYLFCSVVPGSVLGAYVNSRGIPNFTEFICYCNNRQKTSGATERKETSKFYNLKGKKCYQEKQRNGKREGQK